MPTFIFICPITGFNVQHWLSDEQDADENQYDAVTCTACGGVHFVGRKTQKVLGQENETGFRFRPR